MRRLLWSTVLMTLLAAAPAQAVKVTPYPGPVVENTQAYFLYELEPDDPDVVELVPVAGTATAGVDFSDKPIELRRHAYPEAWVDVLGEDWAFPGEPEPDETFTLQTRDGEVVATVTIREQGEHREGAPSFRSEQPGSAPSENAGSIPVEVTATGTDPASVTYRTIDAFAKAGPDYEPVSGRLDFPRGGATRTVEIPLPDDRVNERGPQIFFLVLEDESGIVHVARLNFTDDDYVQMSVAPLQVRESDTTTRTGLPIRLDVPSESMISAPLVAEGLLLPGGAQEGADFLMRDQTASFAPGQVETSVEAEIIGDDVVEGPERFFVHHPYGIQREQVRAGFVDIEDDDTADVAAAGDHPLLALGRPGFRGRTVAVDARCVAAGCSGRLTFAAAGRSHRRSLRLRKGELRRLRLRVGRATRRVRVTALVRSGGRTARASASARRGR